LASGDRALNHCCANDRNAFCRLVKNGHRNQVKNEVRDYTEHDEEYIGDCFGANEEAKPVHVPSCSNNHQQIVENRIGSKVETPVSADTVTNPIPSSSHDALGMRPCTPHECPSGPSFDSNPPVLVKVEATLGERRETENLEIVNDPVDSLGVSTMPHFAASFESDDRISSQEEIVIAENKFTKLIASSSPVDCPSGPYFESTPPSPVATEAKPLLVEENRQCLAQSAPRPTTNKLWDSGIPPDTTTDLEAITFQLAKSVKGSRLPKNLRVKSFANSASTYGVVLYVRSRRLFR